MANEPGGGGAQGPSAGKELPQHPLVESLKPDPAQPAKKTVVLIGLPGKSDRPGYQRLYLTTKLNYYAEFLVSGILSSETIAADKSPFPGHEATQVTIGRDANIQYISATSPQPVDEFDLDVRLGAPAAATAAVGTGGTCPGHGGCTNGPCHTDACPTQDTCPLTQCDTCHTHCGTCANTCPATCQGATCHAAATCVGHGTCVATQCVAGPNDVQNPCVFTANQGGTCNTCVFTACAQATCANTACAQATCHTCPAAATCPQTCGG